MSNPPRGDARKKLTNDQLEATYELRIHLDAQPLRELAHRLLAAADEIEGKE